MEDYIVSGSNNDLKDFVLVSEGVHEAVCVDIVDEGRIPNFEGKKQHKCRLVFETLEVNDEGVPLTVSNRYTVSLHKAANLRQVLEKWRGRAFTEEELKGFSLNKLIGIPAQIVVTYSTRENGRTFANIDNIIKSKSPIQPSGAYIRRKDREGYTLPAESPWNPPHAQRQPQRQAQPQRQSAAPQPQRQAAPQAAHHSNRLNRPQPAPAQETESVPAF